MPLNTREVRNQHTKQRICKSILTQLPDWFGNKEAIGSYINGVVESIFLTVNDEQDIVKGFISLRQTSPVAAEIYVMAVSPDYHGHGAGRLLMKSVQKLLWDKGIKYLIVKTLSSKSDDKFYAGTRSFYISIGFEPLEELNTFWDEDNPCLNMLWVL